MNQNAAVAFERDSSEEWRPRLNERLKMEIVEDEAILLDRTNQRVHHLNEVGTFILDCCTGRRTRDEIVAAVVDRYEVDGSVAESDASELLERLRDLDVLV